VNGQKLLLAVRNMCGESEAAWRCQLDDLVSRGLQFAEPGRHRRRGGAGALVGKHLPTSAPPNALTLPLDAITLSRRSARYANFPRLCDTTRPVIFMGNVDLTW
jgi:hypothetical protein